MDILTSKSHADINTFFHLENNSETIKKFTQDMKEEVETMDNYILDIRSSHDFVTAFIDPFSSLDREKYVYFFARLWIETYPPGEGGNELTSNMMSILDRICTSKNHTLQTAFFFFSLCMIDKV